MTENQSKFFATEQVTRQENLDNIKSAFALFGKNVGCSVAFRGKVVLVNMLVNDGESHWDEDSINAYVEMMKSVSDELMEEARRVIEKAVYSCLNKNITDWGKIKGTIKDTLSEFVWKKTKRRPMILPIIMEI